jgi:hypothetical protein
MAENTCQMCENLPVTLPRMLQLGLHDERGAVLYQCSGCGSLVEGESNGVFTFLSRDMVITDYPAIAVRLGLSRTPSPERKTDGS